MNRLNAQHQGCIDWLVYIAVMKVGSGASVGTSNYILMQNSDRILTEDNSNLLILES